ncbi:MAG: hypothetical protein JXA15_03525 [Spirochaetales bacterium]|nr:hypothetical protein [Spirochaetales bacterium]
MTKGVIESIEPAVDRDEAESGASGKIHCANCIHCKLVPSPAQGSGRYYLRVRCDAGKWKKKLGEEKIYKYFTVVRRAIDHCDAYEDMGEEKDFIRDLKRSLPDRDEIYTAD